MDISETVLFNELSQIFKKEQRDSGNVHGNPVVPLVAVKKDKKPLEKVDQLFRQEKKLIEILLLYGNHEVDFVDYIAVTDDKGKKTIQKEKYKNVVSNEIYLHLQEDEIEFANPIFLKIYYEVINQLNQKQDIKIESFTNHDDTEISSVVTNILMDEEQYVLSDWERHEIMVKTKESKLSKLITDVIYNLRRILIEDKIKSLVAELDPKNRPEKALETNQSDLELVQKYTELKKLLFEKLNRVL
jgi:DNA primase